MRACGALLLASAIGCSEPPPAPAAPVIDPAAAKAEAVALAAAQPAPEPPAPLSADAATGPASDAAPADLVFVWHSVGPLYQGFFTTQDVITALAVELGPWVSGRVNIAVHWNEEDDIGRIRIVLLPGTLRQPVRATADSVHLQDLAPITTALARYRSALAARFDLRIESFRVEVESVRGARACVISLTGTPPPDGRVLNPCVHINGVESCGQPSAAGVRFEPKVAADLQRCLAPEA